MTDAEPKTTLSVAFEEAEKRKAALEAELLAKAQAAAVDHVYDPNFYPDSEPYDTAFYEGTGIGALYGVPGSEHLLPALGDWRLGREQ
jgi:hypothetical protein